MAVRATIGLSVMDDRMVYAVQMDIQMDVDRWMTGGKGLKKECNESIHYYCATATCLYSAL